MHVSMSVLRTASATAALAAATLYLIRRARARRRILPRPPGLLDRTAQAEPGLVALVLSDLSSHDLVHLACVSQWMRRAAVEAADETVCTMIATKSTVQRWVRAPYAESSEMGSDASSSSRRVPRWRAWRRRAFEEMHHIEAASRYIPRISGRYRLSAAVVLDVAPSGQFVNYASGALIESKAHEC